MSDQDRAREREHWQAIAEQLGLAPEPMEETSAPEPVRPSASRPAAENVTPLAQESRHVHSEHAREENRPIAPEVPPSQFGEGIEVPAIPAGAEDNTLAEGVQDERISEFGPREERGRAKRGRGRRSKKTAPAEERRGKTAPARAQASVRGSEPEEGEPRRARGRGRGTRGRRANADRPPDADQGLESESLSAGAADAVSEDLPSLTDWNVPSWNELIASLYRPER